MKCPKGRPKRRVAKPHGSHSHLSEKRPYKHSIRGHTWKGHGKDRRCEKCGAKPRHSQ